MVRNWFQKWKIVLGSKNGYKMVSNWKKSTQNTKFMSKSQLSLKMDINVPKVTFDMLTPQSLEQICKVKAAASAVFQKLRFRFYFSNGESRCKIRVKRLSTKKMKISVLCDTKHEF